MDVQEATPDDNEILLNPQLQDSICVEVKLADASF